MKGFNLIELIVVIAIIVILASTAILFLKSSGNMNTVEMTNCERIESPTQHNKWRCDK